MYQEILKHLKEQLSLEEFKNINNKTIHLGIFTEPCLTYMLEKRKTIESRFSKKKFFLTIKFKNKISLK